MHLSIHRVLVCSMSKTLMATVPRLLADIRVSAQIKTIPMRKGKAGGVQYRAVFGKLELLYTISGSDRSLSLSSRSDMTPIIVPNSSFTEITGEEISQPLQAALSLIDRRGNAFEP